MVLIYYLCLQSGAEHEGFKDMVDTTRNVRKRGQTCQVLKSFNPTVLLPGLSILTTYLLFAIFVYLKEVFEYGTQEIHIQSSWLAEGWLRKIGCSTHVPPYFTCPSHHFCCQLG